MGAYTGPVHPRQRPGILCLGEIFSIFPATVADTFATAHAAANSGLLYTAKGVAAFLVRLASLATQQGGHWDTVLVGAAAVNLAAGLVAKGVLQPLRRWWLVRTR